MDRYRAPTFSSVNAGSETTPSTLAGAEPKWATPRSTENADHLGGDVRVRARDGLLTRTIFPTIPPRVDYELTKLGRSLRCAVEPLGSWARSHVADIHKAREKFDTKK